MGLAKVIEIEKKNVFLPSLQTKGPPESPWQASFSPSEYPAQIIEFVMFRKLKLWSHWLFVINGRSTHWMNFGEEPSEKKKLLKESHTAMSDENVIISK